MRKIKIAYIGGGSKEWARVFMTDLALASDIFGEIALYDIDISSAIRNQKIGSYINKDPRTISKWDYQVYENIEGALKDATFVVISILPGTFKEMQADVHTPEKYEIFQSVGDTVGPGGIIRSMRTIPAYEFFARKIKECCPNAWVINFTNPMNICVKALYDVFPQIKAFGCCHEVFHTQDFLRCVLKEVKGIETKSRKDIYTDVYGINHFTWFTQARYQDIDLLKLLPEFMEKFYDTGYYEHGSADQYLTDYFAYSNRIKMNLYQRYGVLGAAGDRHLVEFMNNSWYLKDRETVSYWKFNLTPVKFRMDRQIERIQESQEMADGKKFLNVVKSDEEAVDLMKALLGYKTMISNCNMPNIGQCSGLPLGSIVETNCVFSNDFVKPITAKEAPTEVKNLIIRNLMNIDTCYEGIKERNLDKIFASFVNQPLCSNLSLEQAKSLFKEMLENTRKYLDEYYDIDAYLSK